MKKTLRIFLPLLAVLTMSISSFAADGGGGKHDPAKSSATKQTTTVKKSKAFDLVVYGYKGTGSVNDPSNYTSGDPGCSGSGSKLCSVSFDDSQLTLAEAVVLLSAPFTNGQQFTDGSGNTVTVHTKL